MNSIISVMMGYLAGSGMPPGDTFGFLVSTIGSSFSALTLPASFSSLGDPGPAFIYLLDGKVYDSGGSGAAWLSCAGIAFLGTIQLFWVPRDESTRPQVQLRDEED